MMIFPCIDAKPGARQDHLGVSRDRFATWRFYQAGDDLAEIPELFGPSKERFPVHQAVVVARVQGVSKG
jgi:hypothetical protein